MSSDSYPLLHQNTWRTMPNSCSSLVFVKLFVWHEKLFLVNAKLFQCQIVAAPWSTWNCSFSGLSSWQPTTCLSSDLSISGKIIIINHHPNVSLRKKVHCSHNLVATCFNNQALLAPREVHLRQLQVPRPGKYLRPPCPRWHWPLFFQAFSVFFICIALTSDMICFLFIPVHW